MRLEDYIVTKFEADTRGLQTALNQIQQAFAQVAQNIVASVQGASRQAGQAAAQIAQQAAQATQAATQQAIAAITASARRTPAAVQPVAVALDQVRVPARQATDQFEELSRMLGQASSSFRRSARTIITGIESLDVLSVRLDRASMMMWRFTMAVIPFRMLAFYLGAFTAGLAGYVRQIVMAAGQLETARKAFEAATGSIQEANEIIEYVRQQAPKIRYTLAQIIEAARILTVAGYDVKELLMPMADLAAGINQAGVDIASAARAFVDAMHGEFRRLKNTFDITKQEVLKFAEGAIDAQGRVVDKAKLQYGILMAIQEKYGGANQAAMESIAGAWANFSDSMTRLAQAAGQNLVPFFVKLLNTAGRFLNVLERLAQTPFTRALITWVPLIGALTTGLGTLLALMSMLAIHLQGITAMYRAWLHTGQEAELNLIRAHNQLQQAEAELAAIQTARMTEYLPLLRLQLEMQQEQLRLNELIRQRELEIARAEAIQELTEAGQPVPERLRVGRRSVEEINEQISEVQQRYEQLQRQAEAAGLILSLPELRAALPQINEQLARARRTYAGISERLEEARQRRRELSDHLRMEIQDAALRRDLEAQHEQLVVEIVGLEEAEERQRQRIGQLERQREQTLQRIAAAEEAYVAALRGEHGERVRNIALMREELQLQQQQVTFARQFREAFLGALGFPIGMVRGTAGLGVAVVGGLGRILGGLVGMAVWGALIAALYELARFLKDYLYRRIHTFATEVEKLKKSLNELDGTTVELVPALKELKNSIEKTKQRFDAVEMAYRTAALPPPWTRAGFPKAAAAALGLGIGFSIGLPFGPALGAVLGMVVPAGPVTLGYAFRSVPEERRGAVIREVVNVLIEEGRISPELKELLSRYGAVELIPDEELAKLRVTKEDMEVVKQHYQEQLKAAKDLIQEEKQRAQHYDEVARRQLDNIERLGQQKQFSELIGRDWDKVAAAIRASDHPAAALADTYSKMEERLQNQIDSVQDIEKEMEKQVKQGRDANEVAAEYRQKVQQAQRAYEQLVYIVNMHNQIDERNRENREELIRQERERLELAQQLLVVFEAQQRAIEGQIAAQTLRAAGAGGLATERFQAALRFAEAEAEFRARKFREARKDYAEAIEHLRRAEEQQIAIEKQLAQAQTDPVRQAQEMLRIIDRQIENERRWYAFRRRWVQENIRDESQRQMLLRGLEEDHQRRLELLERRRQTQAAEVEAAYRRRLIAQYQVLKQQAADHGATKAQLLWYDIKIAEQQEAIARAQGKVNEAAKYTAQIQHLQLEQERQLYVDTEARLKAVQEYNRAYGTTIENIRQVGRQLYEVQIQEARWLEAHGRVNEAMKKYAEAQQTLISTQQQELDYHRTRLQLAEKLYKLGMISEGQLAAIRQQAARQALALAREWGLNTKEGMEAYMRYLDIINNQTADKTEALIRKVIGAPQEALEQILSPATLQRYFGQLEGTIMPLTQAMSADIVSFNKGELTIRIRLDGLPENIDNQIKQAIHEGIDAMARTIAGALNGR
ncbi:MAG: hypothetical protein JRD89_00115 [Deltaproteobacteria bacterium]|nr:hypothetical protein [Deltaproteobacteria bacterium]